MFAAGAAELVKPAPDTKLEPFRERITGLVKARYPQLLLGNFVGTPVLTVLFNTDGTIERSDIQMSTEQRAQSLTATESQFHRFGLRLGDLQYVGMARVALPGGSALVVFGARTSEELDRALVEKYFPDVLTQPDKAGDELWILFDHAGHVLKSGEESVTSDDLEKRLLARYPGIRISDVKESPVKGTSLHLHCVWLAADSPSPGLWNSR